MDWSYHLHRDGRSRNWILPFGTDPSVASPGTADELAALGPLRIRPALAAPVVVVLLLAGLVSVPFINHARCANWWSPAFASPLVRVGDQCVGVSDNPVRDFLPNNVSGQVRADLKNVYKMIMDANHEVRTSKDTIAIVYLNVLTPASSNSYRAVLEELRGIAVAQYQQLRTGVRLRVLFANGGESMEQGERAAEKILEWAKNDHQLAAVVGVSVSSDGAKKAIRTLGGQRGPLPVIGTITSADDMAKINEYYRQVGPNNWREAHVAAYYAKSKIMASQVSIYYSGDPADRFSVNLAEDAAIAFPKQGIKVNKYETYRPDNNHDGLPPRQLGEIACPADRANRNKEVIFYAGRAQHLQEFLQGLTDRCGTKPPPIIAGDSASRFVLDGQMSGFQNVQLDYVSFASPTAWATNCTKVPFYRIYSDKFLNCRELSDGRAAITYDAAQVVIKGVTNTRVKDVNAPLTGLINGINNIIEFEGASGFITFTPYSGVPRDKAVLLMRAGERPQLMMLCGSLPNVPVLSPDNGCPKDASA